MCIRDRLNLVSWFSENNYICCHQMSHFKTKMHQIRFRPGLRPRSSWRSLQRFRRPLQLNLRRPTFKENKRKKAKEKGKKEKKKETGKRKERKGKRKVNLPTSKKFLLRPWLRERRGCGRCDLRGILTAPRMHFSAQPCRNSSIFTRSHAELSRAYFHSSR